MCSKTAKILLFILSMFAWNQVIDAQDCGNPSPANGTASTPNGTTLGVYAFISCDPGFDLNGDQLIVCTNQSNVGWSSIPTCEIKDCGDPTPMNGNVSGNSFTYTSTIVVACDTGYVISGSATITCEETGTWSDNPTCQLYDCGDPSPVNGAASITSGTTFGSTAALSCNIGYILNGSSTAVCGETGWNSSAVCSLYDCGDPTPGNGTSNTPEGTTYGEVALVKCNEGYDLVGDTLISCLDGGNWSSNPSCVIKVCGDPTPSQGTIDNNDFSYNSTVTVTCDGGHVISGSSTITCQADGTWSDNPICDPSDCGSATPANGQAITPSGTTLNQTATISCNSGYTLNGSTTITCTETGWDSTPTCEILDCGDPGPSNGNATLPAGTTYGSTAFITCNNGYVITGVSYLSCLESGQWSSQPSCIRDCGSASPLNGVAVASGGTTLGQLAMISCNEGYSLNGSSTLNCTESGWDSSPTCGIQDCGNPTPANGQANTPDGTTYGSAATITCDSGYVLNGSSYLTCQNGSSWSDTPTCLRDCGNAAPSNGIALVTSGTTLGQSAIISCDPGYTLNGSTILNCTESGWDSSPRCDIQDCGDPEPTNGVAVIPDGTTYGSSAIISCNSSYTLVGSSYITCQNGSQWSDIPTCVRDCGSASPDNGVAITTDGTTLGANASISCNPGYNLNGTSSVTCTESGWDTLPTCEIQDCGDPTPGNGTSNTPEGTTYGEVALVKCNEGYDLVGDSLISCLHGGNWSSNPSCVIKVCGDPTPSQGTIDNNDFSYNSTVTVTCDGGHVISGSSTITCQADGTWSDNPICDPSDCGSATPANGQAITPSGTTLNQTATISCNSGYTLNGSTTITCTETGWDSTPTCEILDCGDPGPSNGNATLPAGTTYGSTAFITCNNGNVITGVSYLSCLESGQWSSQPSCIRDCGSASPLNGVAVASGGTTLGQLAMISCNEGYSLNGSSTLNCTESGWDSSPTCDIQDCGNPTPANGQANTPDGTTYGSAATITCDSGYVLNGSSYLTCQNGSSWSDTPTCLRDCGNAAPSNGIALVTSGTTLGQSAIISCDPGYTLNGSTILNCTESGWDSSPRCDIQDCGDPEPTNGVAVIPDGTTYGSSAIISCNSSYTLVGSSYITCQNGSQWSDIPTCVRDCGSASPDNGVAITTDGTTLGANASISCNPGYNLNGTSSVTCTESGWDTLPTCEIQDCGDPTPGNGTSNTPEGTTYGEVALVKCNEGYDLVGDSLISCLHGGNWSSNPSCVIKVCGDPTPSQGTIDNNDFSYNSTVTVTCDGGHVISGSSTITCQADGTWSDNPICDPSDCGSATPANGQAITPSGTTLNQTATISCNSGYTLNGSTTITCTETGWDSTPTCEILDCGDPGPSNGNATLPAGTTYGSTAFITCNNGNVITGVSYLSCLESGQWSSQPSCIRDCGSASPLNGVAVASGGTTLGQLAMISCNEGYSLNGSSTLNCTESGWDSSPTCDIQDCGNPTPANGQANTPDGTTYGSAATITCDSGYVLNGSSYLTCQNGSSWSDTPTCLRDCGNAAPSNGIALVTSGTTLGQSAIISCDPGYTLNGSTILNCTESGWDSSPRCDIQDCGDPEPTNGVAVIPDGTTYGSSAIISCNSSYTLVGSSYITCQNGSQWSDIPTCVRDCGSASPDNGVAITTDGTTLGANASISCNPGYNLNGTSSVTCTESGWDTLPTCEIQDCGDPTPGNGTSNTPEGTTYGEVALVKCNEGYDLVGDSLISCLHGGNWSSNPSCVIKVCGDPTPSQGTIDNNDFSYNSTVTVTCDGGHVISGSSTITCQADGTWSDNPICDPSDCGSATPANGQAITPSGTTLNQTATISCNSGYTLNGSTTITCTETGWDSTPTCEILDCGDPGPSNGNATLPAGTTYGSTAFITCNNGYVITGVSYLSCLESGQWSSQPSCIRDCGSASPLNGVAVASGGTTLGQLAMISCNEGYSLNGSSTLNCTESGWDSSPTCDIQDCGNPTPANGQANTPDGTTYGSAATITCDSGYVLNGSSYLTCQNGSSWSDTPTCLRDCGNAAPSNGIALVTSGTTLGQSAIISCDPGYTLNGSTILNCTESGWDSSPRCDIQDCGDPEPTNGVAVIPDGTTYGSSAIISCNSSYTLVGSSYITCQNGSQWSDIPTCVRDCGSASPDNGVAITTDGTTLGANASISCNPGYNLNGTSSVTCTESGWDTLPTCEIQDCGDPTPGNGTSNTPEGTTYGEVALVKCNEGYDLVGDSLISCLHGGNWSSNPSCVIKVCGDPTPSQGTIDNNDFSYNSTVTVTCDGGHVISGSSTITCQADGTWSDNPICDPSDCGSATPANGQAITPSGTTLNQTATISCNSGYTLNGSTTITCTETGWDSTPTCEILDCGDPGPSNGNATLPAGTTYGSTAFITCNNGYVITGVSYLSCLESGQWSSQPSCIRDCGSASPLNGVAVASGGTTLGQLAMISCNEGYSLNGSSTLNCTESGWDSSPTCDIQDCGNPTPANGQANTPDGTTYGSAATITCDSGYVLNGSSYLTCQNGSSWSDTPTCLRDCGNAAPSNGIALVTSGTTLGQSAIISCDPGYTLNGSTILNCTESGWDSSPRCDIQDCGDPEPTNGVAVIPDGTTYGSSAIISCNSSYTLVGSSYITCQNGSQWSDIPTCVRDCGSASPDNGVAITTDGTTLGANASISCNPGYNLNGTSSVTCTESGWDTLPTCEIQDCGDPTPGNGTSNTPEGTTYGEVALVKCNEGYDLVGDSLISCLHGGNWSSNPSCVIKVCGDPTPSQGTIDNNDFSYNSTVTVTCDGGHVISGSSTITCQADGTWSDNPICDPSDCGSATPANGQAITPSGTTLNQTATISCNSGYTLNGSTTITCTETGWDSTPTCEILDCGDPGPSNGNATLPAGTTYGSTAFITCNNGYVITGVSYLSCLESGQWSSQPSCIRDCGSASPLNGVAVASGGTTLGQLAMISCNEGYSLNGSSTLNCTESGWDSSPTCDIQDCGNPTPANGQANTPDGTTYGSAATITCDSGYVLNGSSYLTCQNGSSWSDTPTCLRDCGNAAPSNGIALVTSGTTLGQSAIISCDPGYTLNGSTILNCTESGWDSSPRCDIQDCGDPEPTNGVAVIPDGTTYGSSAIISCNSSYTLVGSSYITCQNGSQWSDIPTCVRDCGSASPDNGVAITTDGTTLGANASISCNPGYNLNGTSSVTCTESGWDTLPTCEIQDCGDPTPGNGTSNTPEGTTYGEVALVKCNEGYDLVGDSLISCLHGGNWSSNPSCVIKVCGDPTPSQGTIDNNDFSYNSTVTVTCDGGHVISGSSTITCQADGTWSDNPICDPSDCGSATPANGQAITPSGTTLNQTATISCNSGYTLNGSTTITCTETGWDSTPTCEILDCGDPGPSNGNATLPAGTTYGSTAFITCNYGYVITGVSYLSCLESGQWSSQPSCIRDCGSASPLNGVAVASGGTTLGQLAMISCNEGYSLNGSSTLNCTESGWDSSPTCDIQDCGNPTPANGQANTPDGTTYGSAATITCDSGYVLNGSSYLTCQNGSSWSDTPTCLRDCGNAAPSNGIALVTSGTTLGQSAIISCDPGYTLNGSTILNCTESGWDSSPRCDIQDCGDPTTANGTAIVFKGTTYGEIAYITCNDGFTLQGHTHIVCNENGVWSSRPSCLLIDCGNYPVPYYGTLVSTTGTKYGDTAIIGCISGYVLAENDTKVCQADGTWSGSASPCQLGAVPDTVTENQSSSDSSLSSPLVIGLVIGLVILLYVILLLTFLYFQKCRNRLSNSQHDTIHNTHFDPHVSKVSAFDEEDEVYDEDAGYPSMLSVHPPPSTRHALPPIRPTQTMSRDKVNVVQPLKDKESSDSDVSKSRVILDEGENALPSTSNSDGSAEHISGDTYLAPDIEKAINDTKKNEQSAETSNENLTSSSEPESKMDANVTIKNETKNVVKRRAPSNITKFSKNTVTIKSTKSSTETRANARSSNTQAFAKNITQNTDSLSSGRNPEPGTSSQPVHAQVVPTIDISQQDESTDKRYDVENPAEILSDFKVNTPVHESGAWFDDNLLHPPITVVNTQFEKPIYVDHTEKKFTEGDHLNLDSVSNTDTDNSVKQAKNTESSKNHTDPHLSTAETNFNTQHQVASVASINSHAPNTVPSVEDVTKVESSPDHSSKSGTEPETDNTVGGTYVTDALTSSDSEIDIPVSKHKLAKPFLHEAEASYIRMPIKRDSVFFSDESTAESKGPPRPEFQKGRSAMTLRSAASTRLLTSSYGSRPNESVKVYNPAIQIDPKVKEQKQKDVEKEREKNEKSRKRRFTAMKGIYKIKQQKGVNSRKLEYK